MDTNKQDTNIYIKEGRKYRPVGMYFDSRYDYLTEGVWVVLKNSFSVETIKGSYLKELFGIDKMSDLTKTSFAELGDMHKKANEITMRLQKEETCKNISEIVHTVLKLLKEIQEEDKNKE